MVTNGNRIDFDGSISRLMGAPEKIFLEEILKRLTISGIRKLRELMAGKKNFKYFFVKATTCFCQEKIWENTQV